MFEKFVGDLFGEQDEVPALEKGCELVEDLGKKVVFQCPCGWRFERPAADWYNGDRVNAYGFREFRCPHCGQFS